jgi:hypothetical protein
VLEGHAKGFAKDKVNLDGVLVEKLFCHKTFLLRDATKKSSEKILNLRVIHIHIRIVLQNLVLDFETDLKILDCFGPQSQQLVQRLLGKRVGPVELFSLRVFKILRCTQRRRNLRPDKILYVGVKAEDTLILKQLAILGPELFENGHGYLFSHLYRNISSH